MIDAKIVEYADWRGEMLSRIRLLIKKVDPRVVEKCKCRGVPTSSHDGIICTGEIYERGVKMTFARGTTPSTSASRRRSKQRP